MKHDDYAGIPPSDLEIRALFEGDETLGIILKGHLYIEHFLALLLSTVPGSSEAQAFELRFAQKIDRAARAGFIPADETILYTRINRIRNRFAHQPRSYLSEDDADAIWKALSPRMLERFANIGRAGPDDFDLPLDLFKGCIVVVCSILENELESLRAPHSTTHPEENPA
jgi:hypothetical protein